MSHDVTPKVGDQHLPPITKDHLGGKYDSNYFFTSERKLKDAQI